MNRFLAPCLVLLASAASAATPIENASAISAQLGSAAAALEAASIAVPASAPATAKASAFVPAIKIASMAGKSGSISGYVSVSGNGSMNCSGGPRGNGWMNGWVNLRADVRVTTDDGAVAQFPVTGTVFLSGSCQNGSGFVSGSAMLNGSGALYKAGRYVGTASLSGNAFINQYVTAPFVWITQSFFLNGRYDETAAAK